MIHCPLGCPGAESPRYPHCAECNGEVYPEEALAMPDGKLYCSYCLDSMELSDVLRICEISDVKVLLNLLVVSKKTMNEGE